MPAQVCAMFAAYVILSVQIAFGQDSKAAQGKPGTEQSTKDRGSEFLRQIRRQTDPIVGTLAKEHGYRLDEGELVRRVAPPFPPIRMDYYRTGHPSQAEAIPAGPSAMVFHSEGAG